MRSLRNLTRKRGDKDEVLAAGSLPAPLNLLPNASSENEGDHQKDQEDVEHDFRDGSGSSGQYTEAQYGGDQSDDEKSDYPADHDVVVLRFDLYERMDHAGGLSMQMRVGWGEAYPIC